MEEPAIVLSTLNTDAHAGGHTCRRFSWLQQQQQILQQQQQQQQQILQQQQQPPQQPILQQQQQQQQQQQLSPQQEANNTVQPCHLTYRISCEEQPTNPEEEVTPESVDLLRMLPETQRPKEINPRRTRCAYLQRDDEEGEDSGGGGGGCDDGVLFYNSLRCASEYSNREQEERIAFLSRSYSTLDKSKRNNGCTIYSDVEQQQRTPNVAEYCTSKSHSRSCGSLTYPPQRPVDKNRLTRSARNVYADSNKNLKHKRLKQLRRCVFLGAIFLGIVLATTGIIVAFLVYAPFHMKASSCKNGYVFCGKSGCVTPRRLCGSRIECPGIQVELLCHGNRSDQTNDFIYSEGLPVTLNPLLREGTLLFGKDVTGWVYFQGGSANGSRYITVHRSMTFYGAQESCRDQGGHLAHINTVREQVFLEDYLHQIHKRRRFPSDMLGFWVGARRARGSHAGSCLYNQWRWMDTYGRAHGTITGFTAFAKGKPNNEFAPEECLYMSTKDQGDDKYLKWDDAPCDIHGVGTIHAVCEVEQAAR